MIRKCLFPAAGYGTRFLPATKAMPKEMLTLVNKPLIQYGVEEALAAGITGMAIVTGRGKRAIEDHFDISYELEHQIAGTSKEAALADIRHIIDVCTFSYTRQIEMKGLGHAILTGETLIGDEPFAVILADDYCVAEPDPVLLQMIKLYEKYQCSIVAIEEVPREETFKYGVIDGEEEEDGVFRIRQMVEKPDPADAPSNLAIIGRYILTPDIFDILRATPPGRNGELQITDALMTQASEGRVLGYKFKGRRFDCGSVEGFVDATNHCYQNYYQKWLVKKDLIVKIDCFKAYDIRGRVPDQLNEDIAYRIGRATALFLRVSEMVVGHDIRLSSRSLCDALTRGLTDGGVDVIDIGQCGTEEIYFATSHLNVGGGIVVTASHNPMDYNGMKLVREQSRPISGDTGLNDIKALVESADFPEATTKGKVSRLDTRPAYIKHLLSYIDVPALKPLKLVINAGNGGAGIVADELLAHLPFDVIRVHHEANGNFPNGVPNPLLEENRQPTVDAIHEHNADLGIAWDGDFDRCFFFDETGYFVEGYYIVGLLAQSFLTKQPGSAIIHDPRLIWNTQEICETMGGRAIQCKTGHAFIKERMREEDAIYGGEMSAHHYFRDFAYCDSGMIPWLLVTELMSQSGKKLSELVAERMAAFPASGEINRTVDDAAALLAKVEKLYADRALEVDHTDGLGMNFEQWRFNLRMSNTEPVVRLNVESRGDTALMQEKTAELLALFEG